MKRQRSPASRSKWTWRLLGRPGWAGWTVLLAGGVLTAIGGCKPKQTMRDAGEMAKRFADEAGRMGQKTGEALGIIAPNPVDYVRRAYGREKKPAVLRAAYTLEEEREVGRALAAELFGRFGRYENAKLERYLSRVAAGLCAHSERPELPCCVGVLRSEEVRSFAMPGGYLLVTLGALRVCRSESELAGLLAHGLAHIELRHTLALLENLQADLVPKSAGQPVTKTSAREFSILIETVANQLVQHGPSAPEQRACDRAATSLLVRLGYEPGGLKAFLVRTRLQRQAGAGARPPEEEAAFKARARAIDERLAQLRAPATGRALATRYKRACLAGLPAPRLMP